MIEGVVTEYLRHFPEDEPRLERLLGQLASSEALDDRRNFRGHIAGDAVILSPDHQKILLIYHKRFGNWQQPGGHWDQGEEGPWLTAERESEEETGIQHMKRVNVAADFRVPLHIVTGAVPASEAKNEPDHWHHDFRYGFVAQTEALPRVEDSGVEGVRWLPLVDFDNQGAHDFRTSIDRLISLL